MPERSPWRCTTGSSQACADGDVDAAADVAFRTWQNLADLIPDPAAPTDLQETP